MKSTLHGLVGLLSICILAAACSSPEQSEAGLDLVEDQAATPVAGQVEASAAADGADDAAGGQQLLAVGNDGDQAGGQAVGSTLAGQSTEPAGAGDGASPSSVAESGESVTDSTTAVLVATTAPSTTEVTAAPTSTTAANGDNGSTTIGTTATTQPPATTATTRAPTTTTTARSAPGQGNGGSRFRTLPPGSSLPSGQECASRVRSAPETRQDNAAANARRGSGSNGRYPRVDGNFTGTTDEILQWAACKWGIDEDLVRAQTVKESWWYMSNAGDRNSDQSACHPDLRTSGPDCPESIGILQVRYLYHTEAFENSNAIRSTAYNADYTYAAWRECFEGQLGYLNDVERGRRYSAGDADGCLGTWFSGRWYVPDAVVYIDEVKQIARDKVWEQSYFING